MKLGGETLDKRTYRYYRVWEGDSNDRREITDYIFKGRKGSLKAVDIGHAIAQVRRGFIGKEYDHLWEDTGEGDDKMAILECTEYVHYEDCPMACDPEADCDCEGLGGLGDYIMIEEVETK